MPAEVSYPIETGEDLVLAPETLGVLSDILKTGAPAEQCLVIKTLQAWQDPAARELLKDATRNDDPDVRADALDALSSFDVAGLGDVFLWSLENDPVGDAKVAALRGLGPQDREAAVPLLKKLIMDRGEDEIAWEDETSDWDDWLDVQKEAIRAAGRLGLEDMVSDILAAANDEFGQDLWIDCLAAFAELGRPGLMALIDVGQSQSELQRKRAVQALEASGDPMAVRALDALSQDRSAEVRLAALETSVSRKIPIADCRLVKDPSPVIRVFGASRSPTITNQDLIELATADEAKQVRIAAITRLTERKPSVTQLQGLLVLARTRMRSEADDYIASLVKVISRLNNDEAFEFIEEVQRQNPKPSVQKAVAEVLAEFQRRESLEILEDLVVHKSQMVRLSALASLANLSCAEGEVADNSAALLFLAAKGNLIAESDNEDPAQNGEDGEKQFGARARDDEGGSRNRVVLDREGNVISEKPAEETVRLSDYRKNEGDNAEPEETLKAPIEVGAAETDETAGASDAEDTAKSVAFPTNTLASILQTDEDQVAFQEEKIDLSGDDLKFLELAQSTIKKKRVRPDVAPNTAIDIRKIAVRLIGEQDNPAYCSALLSCVQAFDDELRVAALDAIARRAMRGSGLSDRDWQFLASLPPDNFPQARVAFLSILVFLPRETAEPHLRLALQSGEKSDVVAALNVYGQMRRVPENLEAFLKSEDRLVRQAALRLVFTCEQTEQTHAAFRAALAESGALASVLANGLTRAVGGVMGEALLDELTQACVKGGADRLISLQVLSQAGREIRTT